MQKIQYTKQGDHLIPNLLPPQEETRLMGKLHASLKQRLDAVHKLRFQHRIKTLCRVLRVKHSTYYKHFSAEPSPRAWENQHLSSLILHIYRARTL